MSRKDWLESVEPEAKIAAGRLGLDPYVVLAQWAHETGWGGSNLARNHNNLAGVKKVQHSKGGAYRADGAGHAGYPDRDGFVQDYIRVLRLPYYDEVRGADAPRQQIAALGDSPYAEDPAYGEKLERVYDNVLSMMEPEEAEVEVPGGRLLTERDRAVVIPDTQGLLPVVMIGAGILLLTGLARD